MDKKLVEPSVPYSNSKDKTKKEDSLSKVLNKKHKKKPKIPKLPKKKLKDNVKKSKKKPKKSKWKNIEDIQKPKKKLPKIKVKDKGSNFLNQIGKIEKDLQVDKNIPKKQKKSIEDISYKETDDEIVEGHIKKLRKALGIEKDDSEKVAKAREFKDNLFDHKKEEKDIVTDISLEQKLSEDIEVPPSEEVKHIEVGVSMDTEVPEDKAFEVSDGVRLKSLKDLKDALEEMDNSVFSSHVKDGNDFANWVEHVMNEHELARIIRKCKKKEVLLSLLTSLEEEEIKDLVRLKENDILEEHKESLKELDFLEEEREELNKEKDSIQKLRSDFEEKLKELRKRETTFREDIERTKADKIGIEKEKEALDEEEDKFKSDLEKRYNLKEQELMKAKRDYLESIKKQTDSLNKLREELLKETQKHKQNLEKNYQERMKELESSYQERFNNLKKTEDEFKKEQSEINDLYHEKLEELKAEEEKVNQLQEEFSKQKVELIEQENETRKYLAKLREKLLEAKKKDEDVSNKIETNKGLLAEIKQREEALRRKERDIQHGAFKKYLDTELSKLLDHEEKLSVKDRIDNKEISTLYREIESCKKLLEKGNLQEAKIAYNELRNLFYSADIPEKEREVLFDILQDLYVDIHKKSV